MSLRYARRPAQAPLAVALQRITETRRIVEHLVTSSESFDYPAAKLALNRLQEQVRELQRFESHLAAKLQDANSSSEAAILPFRS
ncbi:MAG: hypothetical protein ACO1QB_11915 [Verrucomicrobiales bacterium]